MDPKKFDLNKFVDRKLIDKTLATARETAGKVKEATEQAVVAGRDRVQEVSLQLLAEANQLRPILKDCGFIIGDVNITFPLPAEVTLTIEQTSHRKTTLEQTLAEDEAKPEGETRLTRMQRGVLTGLVKANDLAVATEKYGYTFRQYDVTLSIPPRVTVHLISKQSEL